MTPDGLHRTCTWQEVVAHSHDILLHYCIQLGMLPADSCLHGLLVTSSIVPDHSWLLHAPWLRCSLLQTPFDSFFKFQKRMALDILIAGKYRLGRKLGGGSFGEIFLGTNLQTGEEVGIKMVSAVVRVNRKVQTRDDEGYGRVAGCHFRRIWSCYAHCARKPAPQCLHQLPDLTPLLPVLHSESVKPVILSCYTNQNCTRFYREEVRYACKPCRRCSS